MIGPCHFAAQDVLTLKDWLGPAVSALTAIVLTCIGYRFAVRQLHHKNALDVQENLRVRQADALQAAWALLQNLTEVDNGSNVIKVVRQKRGPGKTRKQEEQERIAGTSNTLPQSDECSYFIHTGNAQAFVFIALPQAFYEKGAGLLWSTEVKELFFEARSIIYSILLAESMAHAPVDDTEHAPDVRPLKNPDKGKQIQELYLSINAKLREEVLAVYGIS